MRFLSMFVLLALVSFGVRAEDKTIATAFAASAAKMAADGKTDAAKEFCYKALANDENCPEALFELAKIFEKEGKLTPAGDFYVRASREFGKSETPASTSKRLECDTKIKKLNPYATRFASAMTDYSVELTGISKKSNDSFTTEEITDRVSSLKLSGIVPADKLPVAAEKPKTTPEKTKPKSVADDDEDYSHRFKKKEAVTNVPLDVEKALKAAGWEKITGTWKKVKENVYEVTDGKLEAAKMNGAIQVIVAKGDGKVSANVRNGHKDSFFYGAGYGALYEGGSVKLYTPDNYSGLLYRPYPGNEIPVKLDKCQIMVTVMDKALEMYINGKREHKSNYNISKDGPFAIQIDGTATIESPMAKGQ